jgi:hypothetical protein
VTAPQGDSNPKQSERREIKKSTSTMSDNKLAAAAEALVQAAVSETSSSLVATTNREVSDGIKSMNSNMVNVQATMSSIDKSLKTQERMRRVEFALDRCSHGNFDYYPKEYSMSESCDALVKSILLNFHQGFGYYIPLEMTLTRQHSAHSNADKLASNQKFRDALTEQLRSILGVKPVWSEPEQNGRRMIMYP